MGIRKAIAELAIKIVTDESHGYSQPNRLGNGTTSEYYLVSIGKNISVHGGDYDCSSMVWEILKALNLIAPVSNLYTGNMDKILMDYNDNFKYVSLNDVEAGDILLRRGHTEIYIGNRQCVGFSRSENHSIDGKTGDQDGGESGIHIYRPSDWATAYRYVGAYSEEAEIYSKEMETPEMCCIIKLNGTSGHWYFDGAKLHALSIPEELQMLDEIHKANNGKEMPRVFWDKDKLDKFFKFLR